MDYRDILKEENEAVGERYALVMERISGLAGESRVAPPFRDFFIKTAAFITRMGELYDQFDVSWHNGSIEKDGPKTPGGDGLDGTGGEGSDGPDGESLDGPDGALSWVKAFDVKELRADNEALYEDILPQNYKNSYANPAFAVKKLGDGYGQLLSFLYTEVRGMIPCAYEGRKMDMTIIAELFMELYSYFEANERPEYKHLQKAVYWYISDYSDRTMDSWQKEQFDSRFSFIKDIICKADLSDERYLYLYGEYVGENERRLAHFMSRFSEAEIEAMADTFVDGYVRGFKVMGMDLSVKESVVIRAYMGFERIIKKSIEKFEAMGLNVHIFRSPAASINKKSVRFGFLGTSPNPQYEYDHRQDQALYLDKALNERRLSVMRVIYERYKKQLKSYAGPACLQVFGEEPFVPEIKPECLKLTQRQQELSIQYAGQSAQLASQYMDESTMSFTIIAYPLPEIGEDFDAIFRETIRVNTLDNALYTKIQQSIIDVLDKAQYVRVKGAKGKNATDICVRLCSLKNPDRETKFENCVADVNIPAGEVFTSPRLSGTNGTINVSSVYLKGYNFMNLSVVLKDGMVVDYSCDNFGEEEENRRYIKENILQNHDTLPLGEFAIGTNTIAYMMARKYKIIQKLPILIVEKTGPHFALGDTCYSRSEDHKVYNPDGKEIIARENELSALRGSEPEKAYFNCHTDITIPYDEIGEISAILPDGTAIAIIEDGRFVLEGARALNEAFDVSQ